MVELTSDAYGRASHLLQPHWGMARAVLEGRGRGRVWVDQATRPTCALIGTVELWHFAGEPQGAAFEQELREVIERVILPGDAIIKGDTALELTHHPAGWEPRLGSLLGCEPLNDPRAYYELVPEDLQPTEVPQGYQVQQVDPAFMDAEHSQAGASVRDWIDHHHLDREEFFGRSVAMVLTRAGEPVCWCITDSHGDDGVAEIGINTELEHRRRGLASATVVHTCRRLFELGARRIGWHCHRRNHASVGTAGRVGFRHVRDYPGPFRMFDPRRHELVRGWCQLEVERDPAACLAQLAPLLESGSETEADWHVVAARAAARLGEADRALDWLSTALAAGWNGLAELAGDGDFDAVRAHPRWLDLG